jgi:hypothetical protein
MTKRGGLASGLWIHPDDPWGKVHHLSGYAYVPMRLNDDELGWGFQSTPIRTPRRCEHGYTCCIECVDSWALDYEVNWGATAGGRRLRQAIIDRYATDPNAPDVRGVPRP